MANILAFPGKPPSKSTHPDTCDFETAIPLVASTLDGMLIVAPAASPDLAADWSNQELADLYRVEALLVQAGIRISTGRGLTDENEPWFIFCRDDGEVFIHLARIDGTYLLDSPSLGALLEGPDFTSLIDRFVQQVAARDKPDNNVVRFRPRMLHDQTVKLHPTVMLAALVWSLYLASDDLIGAAEAADSLATDSGYIPHDILDRSVDLGLEADFPQDFLPSSEVQSTPYVTSSQTPDAHDRQLAGSQESLRTQQGLDGRGLGGTLSSAAVTPQIIATNLAVIAFGYGLYDTHSLTDVSDIDAGKAAAALNLILNQVYDTTPAPAVALADGLPTELAGNIGGKINVTDPSLSDDAPFYAPLEAMLSEIIEDAHAPIAEPETDPLIVRDAHQVSTEGAGQTVPLTAENKAPAVTHEAVVTAPVTLADTQSVITFVSEYLGSFTQYLLGDITVSATLNHENLDKVLVQLGDAASDFTLPAVQDDLSYSTSALSIIGQQSKSIISTVFADYDDQAKKFLHNFILDAVSLEMLQIENELLLVDMTAIDEPTDHTFVRSWVTDEGYVISTVGHFQTYLDYGLV